jgi:hypothetical protein
LVVQAQDLVTFKSSKSELTKAFDWAKTKRSLMLMMDPILLDIGTKLHFHP